MRALARAAEDDIVVPIVGRDSYDILRSRSHQHLADLEGLGDMADDGVQLEERHGDVGERVVEEVSMLVLDVRPGLDERPRAGAVTAPDGSSSEHVVGAVEREPGVASGGDAGRVLGEAWNLLEEEAAALAGGAEGAVREHHPWQLVTNVVAHGGAPCAADGADASTVAGERKAREDTGHQEGRREVRPPCTCRRGRHRRRLVTLSSVGFDLPIIYGVALPLYNLLMIKVGKGLHSNTRVIPNGSLRDKK